MAVGVGQLGGAKVGHAADAGPVNGRSGVNSPPIHTGGSAPGHLGVAPFLLEIRL